MSVRGTGGEHTPIGKDGTIDVSPRARLFIKESEIVAKLYQGIKDLMVAEKKAGEAAPAEAKVAETATNAKLKICKDLQPKVADAKGEYEKLVATNGSLTCHSPW